MTFGALNLLGFVGATANIVMLIPQGIATWRHRRNDVELRAMSWMTYAVISFQAAVWMVYSFLAHDPWVGAPTFVNLPIAIFTTVVVFRAHRRDHDDG